VQRLEAEIILVGRKRKTERYVLSRDNLDRLYRDAIYDLTTLRNSHNLMMTEFYKKRSELSLLQELVDELHESLSSKDSAIKELRVVSRSQANKMEVLEHNVSVLKNDDKLLKASRDQAMDKVIHADRLLMKKHVVVVLEDIVTDVLFALSVDARISLSDFRSTSATKSGPD
jgi:uncharacterized membrane-anchored protein YjiN (DUF445 family)